MWLNVLTMLRRGCGIAAAIATSLLLAGAAQATTFNFNGSNVVPTCPLTGTTYNCAALPNANDTDVIIIAGGYTVQVSSAVSFSYNQSLQMSGTATLQTTGSGNLNIADMNPANLAVSGGTFTAGGNFKIGNQAQTIIANVNAATMTIGSGSATKITGTLAASGQIDLGSHATIVGPVSASVVTSNSPVSLTGDVTATSSFQLASGSTLKGNLTAPTATLDPSSITVTGNITANNSLTIGSGNTVNGTVKGGQLTMASANVTINGGVTMTGDIDIGSGGTINGDVVARNVNTHSSNAFIKGNAAVNSIYIDWNSGVTKTITCTGTGAAQCSCVTKADPNYQPTCGAAPAGAPHHFQINHSGSALTCQPQTVTVTACANAACTAPNYTSNVNVTLQPGGKTFTVSGGVNSAATVQSATAGTFTLSAAASGVTNATTCVNSGSGAACDMVFSGTGLVVSGSNHVSMASGAQVTIQALTTSPSNPQSCVPLVANQATNITMSCIYSDPVASKAAAVPVKIGNTSLSCSNNSTASIPFTFDANGLATNTLQYAEVGRVTLTASYATSALSATGNGDFIAAPARLLLTAVNAANTVTIGPQPLAAPLTGIFARASEPFSLTVTAVNSLDNPTTNFGKENTPSLVVINPVINQTSANPASTKSYTQGVLKATFPAFSQGRSTASASFNDVGYLQLVPSLGNAANNSTNNYYLSTPLASFQTTGQQYVSRFIPDHFDTALLTTTEINNLVQNPQIGLTMSCIYNNQSLPAGVNPCSGGATSFINSKQFFFMKVTAYNGDSPPTPTLNYTGALASPVTISAWSSNGGTVAADGAVGWSAGNSATRFNFSNGVGNLASPGPGSPNLPSFTFTYAYPAKDVPPATIYLRAADTDNASSQRTTPANSVEAPLSVVSGRLLVSNAYGSPTAPLPVSATAQYFMPGGYVFNPQVTTSGNGNISTAITFTNCQNGLDTSSNNSHTCPSTLTLADNNAALSLNGGRATFRLAAPSPTLTRNGSVDVRLNTVVNGNTVELIPYLPSSTGRETFGIYRSGPVVYTREVYN